MNKLHVFSFFMISVLPLLGQAASFDCKKAGTQVEHLICGDPTLSALDEQLNALYLYTLKEDILDDLTKARQKTWLKMRNTCTNAACLVKSYQTRIDSLGRNFEYFFQSNPYIPLCIEFKAYLERHADQPLFCDLVPDAAFTDFRLPKWEPAPEGLGLRIEIQSSVIPTQTHTPYSFEAYQTSIQLAHKRAGPTSRSRVAIMDINHDGEMERVLHRDLPDRCALDRLGYHWSKVYGDHLNIDSTFIDSRGYASLGGQIFFYKNRVYSVSSSYRSFEIFEPRRIRTSKLSTDHAFCRISRRKNKQTDLKN